MSFGFQVGSVFHTRFLPVLALGVAWLGGCRIERHLLADPGQNQVVRVESGDRFYFDLPEEGYGGAQWDFTCDDKDVDVTIDHEKGEAAVRIRIHRGYDGPSTVRFVCRRPGREPEKSFTVALFKRPGDFACWE